MTERGGGAVLCPEFKLLLRATCWPHDAGAIRAMGARPDYVIDPDRFLALVRRHHVVGLVARALADCEGLLPEHLRAQLRAEAMQLAEEQFRQLLQTRKAVDLLRTNAIAVVVLKGVPAAVQVYGAIGVRKSVDIDLLVARQDIDRARMVLETSGYRRSEPPFDASARQLSASLRYGKDWGFDHAESDTGIELHWRLFQNPRLLQNIGLADGEERAIMPGVDLPVLPEDVAVLYFVAHGAEHGWSRLKWLADLAAVLHRDPAFADRLLASAHAHGIANLTMAALLLCNELYATALPQRSAESQALAREWRTRQLHKIARSSLLGEQDGAELEERPMATTHKNLSHYLFSTDIRYWIGEMAYDLFHDGNGGVLEKAWARLTNVLKLSARRGFSRA